VRKLTFGNLMHDSTGKRVVLASASPRRQEILRTFGLAPEIGKLAPGRVERGWGGRMRRPDWPRAGGDSVPIGQTYSPPSWPRSSFHV